jgi:protein-S-isoprenylcysteine O-methyltransferase Ste14
MSNLTYKIFYALLILAWMIIRQGYIKQYTTIHKIKEKELHVRREKQLVLFVRLSIMIPGFLWLFTNWLSFANCNLSPLVKIIGIHVGGIAAILFWWVHSTLDENWSPVLEIRENHSLVTEGPYQLLRHPMYTAMLFVTIGFFLISDNWLVSAAQLLACTLLFVIRIPDEEKMMITKFGDAYRSYLRQTFRLIPFIY